MARHAGTLGADRLFRDLHDHLVPLFHDLGDGDGARHATRGLGAGTGAARATAATIAAATLAAAASRVSIFSAAIITVPSALGFGSMVARATIGTCGGRAIRTSGDRDGGHDDRHRGGCDGIPFFTPRAATTTTTTTTTTRDVVTW